MLRHSWRLLGWEDTLRGAVVETLWYCTTCKDQRMHVTREDWDSPCPGPSEEVIELFAEEAEAGYDQSQLKPGEPKAED